MKPQNLKTISGWADGRIPRDAIGYFAALVSIGNRDAEPELVLSAGGGVVWVMGGSDPIRPSSVIRHAPMPDIAALSAERDAAMARVADAERLVQQAAESLESIAAAPVIADFLEQCRPLMFPADGEPLAKNYATCRIDFPDGSQAALTMQRLDGKTPTDMLAEKDARIAELESALVGMVNQHCQWGDVSDGYTIRNSCMAADEDALDVLADKLERVPSGHDRWRWKP